MRQKATYPRPDMRLPPGVRAFGKNKTYPCAMCGGSAKRLPWHNVGMRYDSIALFVQF